MCGIVGFTGPENPNALRAMTRTLIHRGPDDEGYLDAAGVSFGARRLEIVDIDTGKQPTCNETRDIWTVFNGEIYNHRELRLELEQAGHLFNTDHSDTEVIVHLYEEYGESWANQVNGMFAVAIWDGRSGKLLLYRDRLGKKPLYYTVHSGQIIFGSEIKALLAHPAVSRELDFKTLYHYLGLRVVPDPGTVYAAVKQLKRGHYLVWQDNEYFIRHFWKADFTPAPGNISEEDIVSEISRLLLDAVKVRLDCDVPVGAYLSGGVDSSLIVSLMRKYYPSAVKTFCLVYEDEPKGPFAGKALDRQHARQLSRLLQTEHHEFILDAQTFAERMPEVMTAFDQPYAGTVSTFFITLLIREHVKVVLSGDGADELFGSYPLHTIAFPMEYYLSILEGRKKDWQDLSDHDKARLAPYDTPEMFRFLIHMASDNLAAFWNKTAVFNHEQRQKLLAKDVLQEISIGNRAWNFFETVEKNLTACDILNTSLEMDQQVFLTNGVLPFLDRLSMAQSVEVRSPYLDYRIVDFINRIPGAIKIKNNVTKNLLKQAAAEFLPTEIIYRPKEPFGQPINAWMHGSLKSWTRSLLESLPADLFNLGFVRNLVCEFENRNYPDLNARVWNLCCFSLWYRQNISLSG